MSLGPVHFEDAPAQPVLQVRISQTGSALGPAVGEAHARLLQAALAAGRGPGPLFLRRSERGATAGVCLSEPLEGVEGTEPAELPASKVACAVWTGDFASRPAGLAALARAVAARGATPRGPGWEVPLTGPSDVARPEDARTQLYLPIEG